MGNADPSPSEELRGVFWHKLGGAHGLAQLVYPTLKGLPSVSFQTSEELDSCAVQH